ncbi:MAG TPA: hypothetical protein VK892_23980, partial [Pyrinomonadaceae bacterium]|nr:hypothetical protein [Pyrinomonadaceae bacterium]
VKDLVEVRSYQSLRDFISDPAQTLANYHFTDATSEMMAKWLDAVADVQEQAGAAKALAGYRGVGKSHFLATLGAICSHPELRSAVSDSYTAAGAQRLKRRRYPVAYVRRGTHATLIEELKDAIAFVFETKPADLSDDLTKLLETAAIKAADLPFVLIVDTAFDRESRVGRDDGVLLGEVAAIAKNLNIFVAVALDDDISGADGVNASIAQNYTIDYLDQEHLYRIVDMHLYPKFRQHQHLLHDIYLNFRQVMPSFRWSEQRFASLYPLHPVILEIAPFVRLYAPEFALLGFAAEAGGKILNRPADSLVALDEVFDRTEVSLRKIEELKETFAAFDRLNSEINSNIPVMQRLQAKLVLKSLLLLSLNGEGNSAGEIGAAMLIFDENDPEKAVGEVESILETFAKTLPEQISRQIEEGRETRYGFKIGSKDNLNNALSEAVEKVSPDVVSQILRRMSREKFSDWTLPTESGSVDWMDCPIIWRGGTRRGRVAWNWETEEIKSPTNSEFLDCEIIIVNSENQNINESFSQEVPRVFWQPAPLRNEEREAILRFYVLLTDKTLRDEYGEQVRAAGHAHTIAVEKIWWRVFLEESKLFIEGLDIHFTDEAKLAPSVSDLFSIMLEPLFEARFPEHPFFSRTIGMSDVSALVNDLFSGAHSHLAEVQQLAEVFALPLGLVASRGETFALQSEENLVNLPLAREILLLLEQSEDESVSLKKIYRHLKQEPFGLVREAQHLILAALVAQRQIEFVTSKGDRINRRSLDLKIIWDDIEGIAKPSSVVYSNERLTAWARILTGADGLQSIDTPEEQQNVRQALENWLNDWEIARVLERFNELPDEILNTKIWRLATRAEKTFGAVAATVRAILDEFISLEEGLHRVADSFSDSEEEFFAATKDLIGLEDFLGGAAKREEIWAYLAVCETTQDEKIEFFRERLLQLIEETYHQPNETLNREMENLWQTFHARFSEHFAAKHDLVMKSHHLQEKFDEILRSDEWWEFENLSHLPIFHSSPWREAQEKCRQFRELDCRFDVREMLKTHPFCACSFNLAQIREWERLPEKLLEAISCGRKSYRRSLSMVSNMLIPIFEKFAKSGNGFSETARKLIKIFNEKNEIPLFSNDELIVIQKALESIPQSSQIFKAENN